MKTEGTFPNVTHWVMPVLCNHCSNAPCVEVCPTEPKAMFKTPEGITMHDPELCIGCRRCQKRLPVQRARARRRKPRRRRPTASSASTPTASPRSRSGPTRRPLIPGCTSAPADVAKAGGTAVPALNAFVEGDEKNDAPGRRGREVHLLLPPHAATACSRPASRCARRRRASSATRTTRSPRSPRCSRRRSPSACRRTRARSRTSTTSTSTAPAA